MTGYLVTIVLLLLTAAVAIGIVRGADERVDNELLRAATPQPRHDIVELCGVVALGVCLAILVYLAVS